MSSSHTHDSDQLPEPADPTEARMRLALGLGSRPAAHGSGGTAQSSPQPAHDSNRQRRRFAQDGEVPVVILGRGRDGESGGENRLATLTADLREERAARVKADRALEAAQGVIQSLQTKLKHAELAWDDKLRAEGEARAELEQLLRQERQARQLAENRAAEAALALSLLDRKAETELTAPVAAPLASPPKRDLFEAIAPREETAARPKRQVGRKVKTASPPVLPASEEEDKPVEWWLPSFRAARKPPARRTRKTG